MKVVDVAAWYGPTTGGIRTYLHAKARWASLNGHDHATVVPGEANQACSDGGANVVSVRGRTPTGRWGYRVWVRPGPIIAALERLQPDVIVLNDVISFPTALGKWASRRGIPVAMICHADATAAVSGTGRAVAAPAEILLRGMQRRALRVPDAVIAPSLQTAHRIEGGPHLLVVGSGLGVDLDTFGAATFDSALRREFAPNGEIVLLAVGRLSSEKRLDLAIRALAALPPSIVLVIAGSGPGALGLARLADRLGVTNRIHFVGFLSDRAELARLMATADCFVHANPHEPFGLAPLEALAAGCRVVVPASAGCAEICGRRGGVLVDPGSADALAAGILGALKNPKPRPDLEAFSWSHTFEREWALYSRLAATASLVAA